MTKLVVTVCAISVAAFGQIGTSTITGRVTDSSSAVAPNVSVSIVHKATNFSYSAVTNADGIYRVPSLQPGEYRVTFEARGFKKAVRDDVDLRTGETLAEAVVVEGGG